MNVESSFGPVRKSDSPFLRSGVAFAAAVVALLLGASSAGAASPTVEGHVVVGAKKTAAAESRLAVGPARAVAGRKKAKRRPKKAAPAPVVPAAPAPITTNQLFAPTSIWNRTLSPTAPLAANSAGYVSELVRAATSGAPWINTDQYSTPVYNVPLTQPTVRVRLVNTRGSSYIDNDMQAAFNAVPLPPNAEPAAGTDRHLVVWQPAADKMWEFWQLQRSGSEWTAEWGGAIQHVSTNPGYFDPGAWPGAKTTWGATASSLPLIGGLMTIPQLQSGKIGHALSMGIPEPARSYVWPAQRSDGYGTGSNAIPEGTIFRLPASLDLASLGLPPTTYAIAVAAQQYGLVVRDVSGSVTLYGEAPQAGTANPYPSVFGPEDPRELLERFPWSSLQAVAPGN